MKKIRFSVFIFFGVITINAQETTVVSGGQAYGRDGTAGYTVGQIAYTYQASNDNSEAQGIQQPYEVYEVFVKDKIIASNLKIITYPNPTTDVINIEITNYDKENLFYELVSSSGQLLETNKIIERTTSIVMKRFPQGTYLLKVTSNQFPVNTFKIIKN